MPTSPLFAVALGIAQAVFLGTYWLVSETIAPTDPWLQYGVLGLVAGAEMWAIVWLARRFIGHLEGASQRNAETSVAVANALLRLEEAVEKMAAHNAENIKVNALNIQRLMDRVEWLDK